MDDNLLKLLAQELGEIHRWEEECPGVYYLAALSDTEIADEYYIVLDNAPISQEARALGRPLKCAHVLAYPLDSEDGARAAVSYEMLKYKTAHGIPIPECDSLRDTALYGMEQCPDYFGTYPVPPQTPWGYTLRHRPLDNGIYWLEAERCIHVLSVCNPVWVSELSEGLLKLAGKLAHEDELGCVFFQAGDACVALWELLRTRPELAELGLIRKPELMNAIWEHHPEYAMGWNAQEQAGFNDGLGLLLYALGVEDRELEGSVDHMISITPESGTDYIGFWR